MPLKTASPTGLELDPVWMRHSPQSAREMVSLSPFCPVMSYGSQAVTDREKQMANGRFSEEVLGSFGPQLPTPAMFLALDFSSF